MRLWRCTILGMWLASAICAQSVITTLAGTDWIFPGDGKPAIDAPLGGFLGMGVAADQQGNFYIGDEDNATVMKVTPDGIIHVIAGNGILGYSGDGGPATSAAIGFAAGVAVDLAGNVYFMDNAINVVRKVTPDGIISTIGGNAFVPGGFGGDGGPATGALFKNPSAIAVDRAGNVYVADYGNHRARKIDTNGIITTVAGNGEAGLTGDGGPATDAAIDFINGIALDNTGNLYLSITDGSSAHDVVRKVDTKGIITTFAGGGTLRTNNIQATRAFLIPTAVAVDNAGNVYIADYNLYRIVMVDTRGILTNVAGGTAFGYDGDEGSSLLAALNDPRGVAVGPDGTVYIGDSGNYRVRSVTPDYIIHTVAGNGLFRFGGDGGPATSATLYRPEIVTADRSGNLYIAEADQNRVRLVKADGTISVFAGTGAAGYTGDGGPAAAATFYFPSGLALDSKGNLFVSDEFNCAIRKITPAGIISTVAGGLTCGNFSGDRGPAAKAELSFPEGLAIDALDNLYIADVLNERVRKIDTAGIITTVAGNGIPDSSGDNGPATAAALNDPAHVALDKAGNLYISEFTGNRVRKVALNGTITTVAGNGSGTNAPLGDGGPAVKASLSEPAGMTLDAAGNLYIADILHECVRMVSPAGIITTAVGNGLAGYGGDGGPATAAYLSGPRDVTFDAAGNLIVADWFNHRIRAVLAKPPAFQFDPASLAFTADAGAVAAKQTLSLAGAVPGLLYAATATTTDGAPWLQVAPAVGGMPVGLVVTADASQLAPGTFRGSIRVLAPNATPTSATVPVTFTVRPRVPARLNVKADALSYSYFQGSTATTQALGIANDGGAPLDFTVAAYGSAARAIGVAASAGTLAGYGSTSVAVTADPAGLAPGTYSVTLAVTASTGEERDLPLTVTVSAVPQSIQLQQTGLTFTAVAGAGVSPLQTIGIVNLGQGSMGWTASASPISGGPSWLSVAPAAGSSDGSTRAATPVTVSVSSAGLNPGQYYGQVQIVAPGADNSPQIAMVVLNVLPPGSNPGPIVQPAGLLFSGAVAAESPGSQTVTISNLTRTPVTFTTGVVTADGGSWLLALPGQATIAPGDSQRLLVQPFTGTLAPGVYEATVTLLFGGGASRVVSVVFAVTSGAGPANPKARRNASGDCPTQLTPRFTSFGPGVAVPAGWPTTVSVGVIDDCGAPMVSGSVVAQFSNGDPAVTLAPLRNGQWTGVWQAGNTASGITIKVTAHDPDRQLAGTAEIAGSVTATPDPPVVSPGGVVNAASLARQGPIAPGSLVSILGSHLATGTTSASSLPWPTDMDGTSVQIQGRFIPLMGANDGRIDAVLPFDLPVNTRLPVVVRRGSSLTLPAQVTIAPAVPAIFTKDSSGAGQGMIFDIATDGSSALADANRPAHAGDAVVIQCTGLGPVDRAATAGTPAPDPAASATAQVYVNIGGVDTPAKAAVLQPGLTGVYQVMATVPDGVAPGDAVTVYLSVTGQASPGVTMAVR